MVNKRVLHIVGDSQFGGGSILIIQLAKEAASRGYDVSVLSTDYKMQLAVCDAGLKVVDLDCIWREIRPIKDLVGAFRLFIYLIKNRYDIVHTHTSKAGFVGRLCAFMACMPVIIHTVHGFAFHEKSSKKQVMIYSFLERIAALLSDKVVTVSEYHREWALRLGICKNDRIIAIPNGISPDRVMPLTDRNSCRFSLGIKENDILLVSAGRLASQKGIEYLIDAMKILIEQNDRFSLKLLLVGDGPMRSNLELKARSLCLEKNVFFLGFRDDIGDMLNAADIAVMPTMREGLSISLLEAMAAGLPIITTTIGSNLEVTEEGRYARLVNPQDSAGLVSAINTFLSDMDAARVMGKVAKEHFLLRYTELKMLDSYLRLYSNFFINEKST